MLGGTMASLCNNVNLKIPPKAHAVLSSPLAVYRYQIKVLNTTHFVNISNKLKYHNEMQRTTHNNATQKVAKYYIKKGSH